MNIYLAYILAVLVVLLSIKFIFKAGIKTIIKLLINALVGGVVLFLINYIPGINITIDIFKSLIVGIFGVPGVIFILIYYFIMER